MTDRTKPDAAPVQEAGDVETVAASEKSDTRPVEGAEPCPFCRSTDIHNWVSTDHGENPAWSVMCFGCECEGPHTDDEQKAIDLWNQRAPLVGMREIIAHFDALESTKATDVERAKVRLRCIEALGALTQPAPAPPAREDVSSPQADSALVEELRGLLTKATKGPWASVNGVLSADDEGNERSFIRPIPSDGWQIAQTCGPNGSANAALIVVAVNALPMLLEALSLRTGGGFADGVEAAAKVADGAADLARAHSIAAPGWTKARDVALDIAENIRALTPKENEGGR